MNASDGTGTAGSAPRLTHLGRLYFLHIPKAAGTSLRLWLEEMFDVERCCPYLHPFDIPQDGGGILDRHHFFSGHHRWWFAEHWGAHLDFDVITFLRRPIVRSMSGLRHLRALSREEAASYTSRAWEKGDIVDLMEGMSDAEVARLPQDAREKDDMTRQLGFTEPLASESRGDRLTGTVDEVVLASALENLRGMATFGLVEHMDRSAVLLADRLGLPGRSMAVRTNVSLGKPVEPSAALLQALHEVNVYDNRLYAAARDLFEERWAVLLSRVALADDAAGRRALGARLDKAFRTTARGLPRLSALTADPSRGMVVDGWKPRFRYEPLNRWLRWSQTARPRLWLPIDRQETRSLHVEIAYTTDTFVRDSLSIEIDGQPVATERAFEIWTEDGNYHLVLSAAIPPAAEAPQYTEIAFRLPEGVVDGAAFAMSQVIVGEKTP